MPRRSFILIVGHGPELEREQGAAQTLRALGAHVRTLEMWEDPCSVQVEDDIEVRVILVETPERPDLCAGLLRAVRKDQRLEGVPAIAAVSVALLSLDPAGSHLASLPPSLDPQEKTPRISFCPHRGHFAICATE